MNIEFSRDLENQKRVLRIGVKETHAVQNVINFLDIVMFARIVETSRVISLKSKKPTVLP